MNYKLRIPVIDESTYELSSSVVFTKLDLRAGYHQMKIHPNDVSKNEFIGIPGIRNSQKSQKSKPYFLSTKDVLAVKIEGL